MSGVTAATIIAGISAAAAVGGTTYGIINGQAQQKTQDKQLVAQKTAQQKAEAQALSNQRKSEVAANEANQKTPDIASILARAAGPSKAGVGSTMLTGSGGVDPAGLNLGQTSLLGK
jgi:uncharacterized protein HemX